MQRPVLRFRAGLPPPIPPRQPGGHAYFDRLASRPDVKVAFSLRDQAQIEAHRRSKDKPSQVTYDPANDLDPRRQDAAKILIPGNSLGTQVWLPIWLRQPGQYLVTWDVWHGREYARDLTGIKQFKTFQFCSPTDEIWCETNDVWLPAQPDAISRIEGRAYQGQHGPNVTQTNPLSPQTGKYSVAPETWTRYWAHFNMSGEWDVYSLWVADVDRDPVLIFDGLQMRAKSSKSNPDDTTRRIGYFRVEFNTSTSGKPEGRAPLVSYVRNFIALQDVPRADAIGLMERPRSR